MISQDPVAHTYAQALLEAAVEKDAADEVLDDLVGLSEILRENQDIRVFLESPSVENDEKKRILENVFGGKVHELTLNFLKVVVDRDREDYVRAIADGVADLRREIEQEILVEVTSAVEVKESELADLKKAIEKKTGRACVFSITVEPEILGGMIFKIGDIQVDGSIRSRLDALQRKFKLVGIEKEAVYEA